MPHFFIFVMLDAAALKLAIGTCCFDCFLHQLRKYAFYDEPLMLLLMLMMLMLLMIMMVMDDDDDDDDAGNNNDDDSESTDDGEECNTSVD